MAEILLSPEMFPFTLALGLLFALLLLEVLSGLLGGSLFGAGGDADADFDLDADFDADFDLDADFDAEIDAGAFSEVIEGIETELDGAEASSGPLSWLGMGKVPFMIWLAAFLLSFGLGGFTLQAVLNGTLGFSLPGGLAALGMVPVGLWFARQFAGFFARLLPKSESSALSANHLGRRRGVISQGTAARGKPAEVRVYDRHGNMHYLRAEPLRDDQEFPQGTEVLVLRKSLTEGYRLVALAN